MKTSGFPLPYEVLSKDLQTGNDITQIVYDRYDFRGNLQQYTTKDGIPIAIVWGYNQTYPIAKIEGAAYPEPAKKTEIPQYLINSIINASNDDALEASGNDETALLTALDDFRKDPLLSDYQITTYTYDPLIGVRSITPPSGVRENYIYDSANRLKEVKDINGTVLKEYQYHYKE
jgi:hypothetical protein